MSKTTKRMSKADTAQLAALLVKPLPVVPVPKPGPEVLAKGHHDLVAKMARAEVAHDTAQNAVYTTFKTLALAVLIDIGRPACHAALLADIYKMYTAARKPAAIQRVTMLNNMRTIVHGKAATKDTPAQPAQGAQIVIDALNAVSSLPALKSALVLLKTETHGHTGTVKHSTKAAEGTKSAPAKASEVQIPSTRAEAIKAACRILEMVATNFLTISKDGATIDEVQKVIKMLQAA